MIFSCEVDIIKNINAEKSIDFKTYDGIIYYYKYQKKYLYRHLIQLIQALILTKERIKKTSEKRDKSFKFRQNKSSG